MLEFWSKLIVQCFFQNVVSTENLVLCDKHMILYNNTFGLSMTKEGAEIAKKELFQVYKVKDLKISFFILEMAIH